MGGGDGGWEVSSPLGEAKELGLHKLSTDTYLAADHRVHLNLYQGNASSAESCCLSTGTILTIELLLDTGELHVLCVLLYKKFYLQIFVCK
jgi:hypothetical protein